MKKYSPKHNWCFYNAEVINVEDGSTFGGEAFIELLYQEHLIRGNAVTLQDAEDIAFNKLLKIQNCCHEFERFNDKGRAKCKLCGFSKDDVFENLERCFECQCKHPVIYVGQNKYCVDHAKEKLEEIKNNQPSEFCSHKKGILTFIYAVEELGLIEDAIATDNLKDLEFVVSVLYRNTYSFLLDIAEEIADAEFPDQTELSQAVLSSKKMTDYYDLLMANKDAIKKFIIAIDEKTILSKDDFKEFVS